MPCHAMLAPTRCSHQDPYSSQKMAEQQFADAGQTQANRYGDRVSGLQELVTYTRLLISCQSNDPTCDRCRVPVTYPGQFTMG